jgi:hypothetical protein
MTHYLKQAYRQAPWRATLQRLGVIFAILAGVAIVALIYLSISAQAAAAGLDFQKLEIDREEYMRDNADLSARLAYLSSESVMQARAKELGYKPLAADKAVYVIVPGYTGRQQPAFAPPPGMDRFTEPLIKSSYTQSLWEVLFQGVLAWAQPEAKQP